MLSVLAGAFATPAVADPTGIEVSINDVPQVFVSGNEIIPNADQLQPAIDRDHWPGPYMSAQGLAEYVGVSPSSLAVDDAMVVSFRANAGMFDETHGSETLSQAQVLDTAHFVFIGSSGPFSAQYFASNAGNGWGEGFYDGVMPVALTVSPSQRIALSAGTRKTMLRAVAGLVVVTLARIVIGR